MGRWGIHWLCTPAMIKLLPMQRRFLRRALAPGVRTAALSLPRGEGKSTLAAYVMQRCLTPGDPLFQAGAEYLLAAASLDQARNAFRPMRAELEPSGDYRWIDGVSQSRRDALGDEYENACAVQQWQDGVRACWESDYHL